MTLFVGPLHRLGGPSIKNGLTVDHLFPAGDVTIVNTADQRLRNRLACMWRLFVSRDPQIIIAVSSRGRSLLWPLVYWKARANSSLRYSLICIGGSIAGETQRQSRFLRIMNRASLTCVETQKIAEDLGRLGVTTTYHFPNMVERIGRTVGETDMRDSSFGSAVTKFVYLSSIRQGKGVGTMLEAFRIACAEGLDASLDIYGPVRPDFDEELFEKYASESRINYRGQVNHDKVVELLNRYQCFIFPSEFDTEGFPAVLVEAFAAGLPVIASDAASNREIVIDGVNGIVYGAGKATELARAMRQMAENPDFMKQASARNLADAPRFEATRVVGDYRQALIEVGWAL